MITMSWWMLLLTVMPAVLILIRRVFWIFRPPVRCPVCTEPIPGARWWLKRAGVEALERIERQRADGGA